MEVAAPAVPLEQADACPDSDRAARLRRVFDACCDGLYRYILVRVGGDRHAADDLLQQTCCTAVAHRARPEDGEACEAWLVGIARNLVRKHWRDRKRTNGQVPVESAGVSRWLADDMDRYPLPAEVLARKEVSDLLLLAVTALPAADQELVFAFYFEERSRSAIAEATGTTVKGIEARLYRVRNRLRDLLKDPERMDVR